MQILGEQVVVASHRRLAAERKGELRRLSNSELRALVLLSGPELTPEELRFIHDIAIERLSQRADSPAKDAEELSRTVMQEAVGRIA